MSSGFFGILTTKGKSGEPEKDHPLPGGLMQIGSANGADIPIAGDQVARVHAQLRCGADGIWIRNLNPNFQTYVDGTPLVGAEEKPLNNTSKVRFGKVEAYIRLAPGTDTTAPSRLGLSASPSELTVQPGGNVTLALTIRNLDDRTRTILLDASCPTASSNWARLSQQSILLYDHPNSEGKDTGTVMITFAPPPEAHSSAGDHEYTIEARAVPWSDGTGAPAASNGSSIAKQDEVRTITVKLTVLPYVDFGAAVETRMVRSRRRGHLLLRLINRSNFKLPLLVSVDEPEAVLAFANPATRRRSITTAQVFVPGEERTIDLPLSARRRRLIGGSRRYPFRITVASDPDDPRVAKAKEVAQNKELIQKQELWTSKDCIFVQPALLPYWALLLMLLLVAIVVGWFWLDGYRISFRRGSTLPLTHTPMIETLSSLNGAVNALNPVPLAFATDGVVSETVTVAGAYISGGQPIASLRIDAQLQAHEQQKRQVEQADRAKQKAEDQLKEDIQQAQQDLEKAQQKQTEVQQKATNDAQQNIVEAQRALSMTLEMDSAAKTAAETKMLQATTALQDAQQKLDQANKDWDWVKREKTHPAERYTDTYGNSLPRPLTEAEILVFEDAVPKAARAISDTERLVALAVQEDKVARETATNNLLAALKKRDQTKQALVDVSSGKGTPELEAAQQAVDDAQRKLDTLQQTKLDAVQQAIEAHAALEAIVLEPPKLIAPADGWVLKAPQPGDQVRASAPVVLFAPMNTPLEVLIPLDQQQWQRIATSQPLTATLSSAAAPAGHAPLIATVSLSSTQRLVELLQSGKALSASTTVSDPTHPLITATLQLSRSNSAPASTSAPSYFLHIGFSAGGKPIQLFTPDVGAIRVDLDTRLDDVTAKQAYTLSEGTSANGGMLSPKKYICGSEDNPYIIVRKSYLLNLVFLDRLVSIDTRAKTEQQVEVVPDPNQIDRLPSTATIQPTAEGSIQPTAAPTAQPTAEGSAQPTVTPTTQPPMIRRCAL